MKIPSHLDWDLLRKFNMCSRHKSFAEAAKEAGIQPPAFGNQMKKLESLMGFELFERSNGTATNKLTNQGSNLLKISNKAEQFFYKKTDEDILQHEEELKIYTTYGIATSIMPNLISFFCSIYPHIKVILLTQYPPKYLSTDEIIIRADFVNQKNLKKIKVIDIEMGFYASSEYIEKHGKPNNFDNFQDHRFLFSYGNTSTQDLGSKDICIEANITSSSIEFSYKICLEGQGIIELPNIYPGIDKLSRVLEGVPGERYTLYLAYIENHKKSTNELFAKILNEYKDIKKW